MKKLTTAFGAPVSDNQNIKTAGKRGPALLQDAWFLEKMAHFDREVIPERRMHAKGAGAFGTFTVIISDSAAGPDLKFGCPTFAQSHRTTLFRAKLEPSSLQLRASG